MRNQARMKLTIPTPKAETYSEPSEHTDTIHVQETSIAIEDTESVLPIERMGGILHAAYEVLTGAGVASPEQIATIEQYIESTPSPTLKYEDEFGQWVKVTNPSFMPREPASEGNSPFNHSDAISTGDGKKVTFTGWQDGIPTFAREVGRSTGQMYRIHKPDADDIFGTDDHSTYADVLGITQLQ